MSDVTYDLNTATEEELTSLPGMTPTLVERIQGGRPYASVDAIKQVQGVSGKLYKKWQPSLRVNGQEASSDNAPGEVIVNPGMDADVQAESPVEVTVESPHEPAASTDESSAGSPEPTAFPEPVGTMPVIESVLEKVETAKTPEAPVQTARMPAFITWTQALLMTTISSGVSFLLAVAATLIVLVILNGGLLFAPATEVDRVDAQIGRVAAQVSTLETNLQAVEERLNTVDALAAKVTDVQNQMSRLQSDVRAAVTMTEALKGDVEAISKDIGDLKAKTQVFEVFLAGLRRLLDGLSQP